MIQMDWLTSCQDSAAFTDTAPCYRHELEQGSNDEIDEAEESEKPKKIAKCKATMKMRHCLTPVGNLAGWVMVMFGWDFYLGQLGQSSFILQIKAVPLTRHLLTFSDSLFPTFQWSDWAFMCQICWKQSLVTTHEFGRYV